MLGKEETRNLGWGSGVLGKRLGDRSGDLDCVVVICEQLD
jgi:hypothetical protein